MLLSFSVTNFKSILQTQTLSMVGTALKGPHKPFNSKNQEVRHGVLPCAVIYGANASGKSNLLDAFVRMQSLVLKSHSGSVGAAKLTHSPFLLHEEGVGEPTTLEVSFIKDDIRFDYGFSFDASGVSEEWLFSYPEGRRRKFFERSALDVSFGSAMKGPKKVLAGFLGPTALFLSVATQNKHKELGKVADFFTDIFSLNKITVASAFIDSKFSDGKVDKRAIQFLEAIGTGVCDYRVESSDLPADQVKVIGELVRVLTSFGDIGTDEDEASVEIDEKQFEVKLGHRNSDREMVYFNGSSESAGTRRLLLMMNYIFQVLDEGDIAIIDEIDASLHTFAVEAILALFVDPRVNRNGAQLVATTHDTNLLNQDNLRRDEIWFAEKRQDGSSEYFSLAEIKGRKGEAVEKAYLQGRYGATPPSIPSELFLLKADIEA